MSIEKETAKVSYLPSFNGDGYGWGGGVVLTIGDQSINLGEGTGSITLAREIAARWNASSDRAYREEEELAF